MLLCLNPFEIRVSFEPTPRTASRKTTCLNPFEIRVSFEPRRRVEWCTGDESQSLRNQGFIRTDTANGPGVGISVSIPSKSGFHSNRSTAARLGSRRSLNPFEIRVSFERRFYLGGGLISPSQSLRNQGFIRTAPTVNGFSLLSSRGSVPILSVLS